MFCWHFFMVDSIDYACSCCIRRYTLTVISSCYYTFMHRCVSIICTLKLVMSQFPRVRDESLKPSAEYLHWSIWPTFTGRLCFYFFRCWPSGPAPFSLKLKLETFRPSGQNESLKNHIRCIGLVGKRRWRKPINLVHNCLFRNAGGVYISVRTLLVWIPSTPFDWSCVSNGSLASSPTGL